MLVGLVIALGFALQMTPALAYEWKSFVISNFTPYPNDESARKNLGIGGGVGANEKTALAHALERCKNGGTKECSSAKTKTVPKEHYLVVARCEKNGEYIFSIGKSDLGMRWAIDDAIETAGLEYGTVCITRFEWPPDQEIPVERNRPLGVASPNGKWKSIVATYGGDGPSSFATIAHVAFGKGDDELKALFEAASACQDSAMQSCTNTVTVPTDWYLTLAECYEEGSAVTFSLGKSKESAEDALKDAIALSDSPEKNECHSYWEWSPTDEWPVLKAKLTRMYMLEAVESVKRRFPKENSE